MVIKFYDEQICIPPQYSRLHTRPRSHAKHQRSKLHASTLVRTPDMHLFLSCVLILTQDQRHSVISKRAGTYPNRYPNLVLEILWF